MYWNKFLQNLGGGRPPCPPPPAADPMLGYLALGSILGYVP